MRTLTPKSTTDIGLSWDNCNGVLAQKAGRMGWCLCVGAGTSRGNKKAAFPDWPTLVKRLMSQDSIVHDANALHAALSGFSPDALIEAARDRSGLADDEFSLRLQEELYRDLKDLAGSDWDNIAKCLTAASPAQRKLPQWQQFIQFFETNYRGLCALQLARVVARTAGKELEPSALISFNAEPLLYALVNAVCASLHGADKPPKKLRMFNRVSRGISYQEAARLPYIFCHGLLEVNGGHAMFAKVAASTEKLVFSEGSYLRLANSSFSWQSAMFLGTAVLRSMVFVGVSFTDPNMRRWLASVHADRSLELKIKGRSSPSYEHYWINRDPGDETKKRWIESLVRHLGVRLVWIPDYKDVGKYLQRMLSLED